MSLAPRQTGQRSTGAPVPAGETPSSTGGDKSKSTGAERTTQASPTLRPLLSNFPQPTGCDADWYVTTTTSAGPSRSVISSGWLDPRYASCQPDGKGPQTAWFSPGICPGQMTTVGLNPTARGDGTVWAATCCRQNFTYVSGDAAACSSTVTTGTWVSTLLSAGPSSGVFPTVTPLRFAASVPAVHDPVLAFFAGSDLCNFPSTVSDQLVSATRFYAAERGSAIPSTTEKCVRIKSSGSPSSASDKVSGATIGGAVAGAVVGVLLLALGLYFFIRRRRRSKPNNNNDNADQPPEHPELDDTGKVELHSEPKPAELGPEQPSELPADNNIEPGIPELDAQPGHRSEPPADDPKAHAPVASEYREEAAYRPDVTLPPAVHSSLGPG
jgi:hypothetical protein